MSTPRSHHWNYQKIYFLSYYTRETTESHFWSPDGKLYKQIEGVAMWSPLGPTFANFYMENLEQSILLDNNIKPSVYCRYVDDIFVVVRKY